MSSFDKMTLSIFPIFIILILQTIISRYRFIKKLIWLFLSNFVSIQCNSRRFCLTASVFYNLGISVYFEPIGINTFKIDTVLIPNG